MSKSRARVNDLEFPVGFKAYGAVAGLKASGRPDLAVIISETGCAAAGMFTRNRFSGPPVEVTRGHIASRRPIRGVIVNSGQANACTGREGFEAARRMCAALAARIDCAPEQILVASTGVIGRIPNVAKIEAALDSVVAAATAGGWSQAVQGIMTTDTRPKIAGRSVRIGRETVRVLGIAKGSGMIHPSMATMLAFVATDARISRPLLRRVVERAVDRSFHCVTVDGDTSTSDMAIVLANGAAQKTTMAAGSPGLAAFERALTEVCRDLARAVAADGEGATRLVRVEARGAKTEADARECAMAIGRSNLVKCAIFGHDPNWGRLACAVGNCRAAYDPERVVIRVGPTRVFYQGRPAAFDEEVVHDYLADNQEIEIGVELGAGKAAATIWTCDLTYDYVKINAEYRT